jgi:flagellar basal body-associated protein FliL
MIILLIVCIAVVACCGAYFCFKFISEQKKRREVEEQFRNLSANQIHPKDLQFLEFTVDMYIKYAKDLNIYSESQHDYIVKELERIRETYLAPPASMDSEKNV